MKIQTIKIFFAFVRENYKNGITRENMLSMLERYKNMNNGTLLLAVEVNLTSENIKNAESKFNTILDELSCT